jgi:hypothetical protein
MIVGESMKINGRITILAGEDGVKIEVHDDDSSITFLKIEMTPEQFCQALSRLSNTHCTSTEVRGLNKVGLVMENKDFVFEVPADLAYRREERDAVLLPILWKACLKGWIPDTHFGSQNSFFTEGKKYYARTTIRRWVEK